MNSQIIKGKNINTDLLKVVPPKELESGKANCYYVNHNDSKLVVQTPVMEIPFGLNLYEGDYPKYSVNLSFKGMDTDKRLKSFYDGMCRVDEAVLTQAYKNSKSWFGKKHANKDVTEAAFETGRSVKEPSNPSYAATLKLKLAFRDEKFGCEFYDKDGNKIDRPVSEILVKRAKAKAIIRCVGVWVTKTNFFCQWQAERMEVEIPESATPMGFLPDSEDEDEDEDSGGAAKTKAPVDQEEGESSDEEDDDDEEESSEEESSEDEPEPEPVKPKKGKKGGTKSSK